VERLLAVAALISGRSVPASASRRRQPPPYCAFPCRLPLLLVESRLSQFASLSMRRGLVARRQQRGTDVRNSTRDCQHARLPD